MKKLFSRGAAALLSAALIMGAVNIAPVSAVEEQPVFGALPEVRTGSECEALFAEWKGGGSYNVYYKAEGAENYIKIDDALVRNDGNGGYRAEVMGLKGGYKYTVKIVPVSDGKENESGAFAFEGTPTSYDRSGYAHFNTSNNPGAYNLDGTLPTDADIIYVNDSNKNSVKLGNRQGLSSIISGYNKGSTPLVIRIIGQVNADGLSGLNGDRVMGVKGSAGLTIEGVGTDACIYGWGFSFSEASDFEVRNLTFSWNYEDAVGIQKASRVWIHDNDFTVGHQDWPPSEADKTNGDGSCDAKTSDYVTVSYNHFKGTAKSILLGSSKNSREDVGHFTYHHNFFEGSEQRLPRVRWHDVHIYNNYYKDCGYALDTHYDESKWKNGNIVETAHKGDKIGYGIGATCNCSIFAESNYFENTYRPMLTSDKNCSALSANDGGVIKAFGNYYDDYSLSTMETKDRFEAPSKDYKLTASDYTCTLGGWTYDNFDTSSNFYKNAYFVESAQDCVYTVKTFSGTEKDTGLTLTNAVNGSAVSTGDGGAETPVQPATQATTQANTEATTEKGTEVTTETGKETVTEKPVETTTNKTANTDPSLDGDYYYDFPTSGATGTSFGGANGNGTYFTASAAMNSSGAEGSVNVNGKTYTFNGVGALVNNGTITFTADKAGTLTIVSTSGSTSPRKLVVSDSTGKTVGEIASGSNGTAAVGSIAIEAGTYTVTNKGGGEAKLFYIGIKNAGETGTYLYGDADLNNKLEAADATIVLQYTLNKNAIKTDADFEKRCDVDKSGKIDANDSVVIMQKVLNSKFVMDVEK